MSKLLTIVILILSQPLFASTPAEEALTQRFRNHFIQHCEELERNGLDSIANIPIAKIKALSQQIQIKVLPYVQVDKEAPVAAVRRTAVWDPVTKTIWISEKHVSRINSYGIEAIAAHEFYRAAGIADENFEASALTSSFNLLNKFDKSHPDAFKNKKSFEILKKNIQKLSTGGISGVGGGGDIRTLEAKRTIFHEIFYFIDRQLISEETFEATLVLWMQMKIELAPAVSDGKFIYDSTTKTFLVPLSINSDQNDNINSTHILIPIAEFLIKLANEKQSSL